MFKVNRQTDYAIRVLIDLSLHAGRGRMPTAEIQREMMVPPAFLQRIVADLARVGLISTYPGRDGGLQLARSAEEITLLDVIEAMEGPLQISECLTEYGKCPLDTPCPVKNCWRGLQNAMRQELTSVNIAKLASLRTEFSAPL